MHAPEMNDPVPPRPAGPTPAPPCRAPTPSTCSAAASRNGPARSLRGGSASARRHQCWPGRAGTRPPPTRTRRRHAPRGGASASARRTRATVHSGAPPRPATAATRSPSRPTSAGVSGGVRRRRAARRIRSRIRTVSVHHRDGKRRLMVGRREAPDGFPEPSDEGRSDRRSNILRSW